MSKKPEKIQKEIDEIRAFLREREKPEGNYPDHRILALIARLNALTAELAEISTRRIVRLTWFLALLTLALLAVEIRSVFFPKDLATTPQHIQTNQNQQVFIPAFTNR